jgi:putative heme-binding domain-containing protein
VLKRSAVALRSLGGMTSEEAGAAFAAAGRLGNEKQDVSIRDQLVLLLRQYAGKEFGYRLKEPLTNQGKSLSKWRQWLVADGVTLPAEAGSTILARQQLDRWWQLDGTTGDVKRGAKVYRSRQCVACHGRGAGIGPRMEGVAQRFTAKDLLTAIVLPHAQVSDRYRATMFETIDGQFYSGQIVYENVDGVTLRESSGRTVRLNRDQIEHRKRSTKSLMPSGLLDGLRDQEVADLMAYLQTL